MTDRNEICRNGTVSEKISQEEDPQEETNPNDTNALFAMTLTLGMQADYASRSCKKMLGRHQNTVRRA